LTNYFSIVLVSPRVCCCGTGFSTCLVAVKAYVRTGGLVSKQVAGNLGGSTAKVDNGHQLFNLTNCWRVWRAFMGQNTTSANEPGLSRLYPVILRKGQLGQTVKIRGSASDSRAGGHRRRGVSDKKARNARG